MTDEHQPDDPTVDDDRRGQALRDLLGATAAGEVIPAPGDDVDELERRAGQRRQRKVVGLATVVVLVLLLGGSAVALGHRSSDGGQVDVASNVLGGTPASSLTTTVPRLEPYACLEPDVVPIAGCELGTVPGTAPAIPDPNATEPTPPPSETSSTPDRPPPTTPRTTFPPASSSSDPPTTPTTTDSGRDCGSSTPSGWPTTTMASPMLAQCLVDGFDAGVPNTLRVVVYRNDPDHPVTTSYEVVGLRRVKVTTDARRSEVPPQTLTVQVCTSLAASIGSADVVTVGGCSPA
jgi:hypothetical protein